MKNKIIFFMFGLIIFCNSSYAANPNTEKWEGKLSSGEGILEITTTPSGLIGTIGVASHGCGGNLEGKALENEDYIIILGKDKDEDAPSCIVKLKKEGNKITKSDEDGDCLYYHGVSCDFSEPNMTRTY
ncbi:hypothetical protein [Novacetimonas hansenii]|nr:hypothetical protein [Novacetimonas hansenii]WEQ58308.1 hypothetical protein LV563_10625 [Novacetimonas hansenii]